MSKATVRFRSGLIFIHRWTGVAFSTLFAVWFLSGVVMMYWRLPRVDPTARLDRSAALDASRIQLSPEQALARTAHHQLPNRVVMIMLDGRPVYRFIAGRSQKVVFADNGEVLTGVSEEMGRRIAASWAGQPLDAARFEGTLLEADQWTVNGTFRAHGALLKYAWPDGQEVYVSPITAEVVQHTTRGSRIGAYFGAIPHWLYITPLRRNGALWSKVVIWCSGVGTAVSLLGLIIGIWRYSPFKRYRTRDGLASFPYTGQKRWHVILGLVFGVFACTWAFSGMMSLDPFPGMTDAAAASQRIADALRRTPVRISEFAAKPPREALAQTRELKTKELEFLSFNGEPFYLANETPSLSRLVPVRGTPLKALDQKKLVAALAQASQPHRLEEVSLVTEYEAYYLDRHDRLPLPVLFIRLNDNVHSTYYIDPRTARTVQTYTTASRWNRWIYQGLHSIDLPWLYRHRPVWDVLVLTLLAGGSALSFTAVVIGWKVVRALL